MVGQIIAEIGTTDPAYLAGQVVPFILLVAGTIKCHQISKRPTANANACRALMFFLGGWAVCVLPVIATTVGYRSMPLIVATGFVFLLALVIAAALAIGGLVEIRKNPAAGTRAESKPPGPSRWSASSSAAWLTAHTATGTTPVSSHQPGSPAPAATPSYATRN